MTNYERIKAMSVEEMADAVMCPNDCSLGEINCEKTDACNCYECVRQWLEQEIKHGKWMRTFPNELLDGNYFCSNCQSGIDIATAEETPTDRELFYCPNCGAKMDGEESGG